MDNDPHNRFEEEKKPLVSNKLKIKLKAFERGIVHGDDDKEARDWICKLCSKKFSSCKALGGHMRVHSETFAVDGDAGDDFSRKSKFRVLERDGKPTCLLCNKSFLSLKSLFGHMRCHPERDWRGMIPPENSPSSTISSEQALLESATHKVLPSYENDEEMIDCSSSGVDLLACLSDGWSVRRRRSGKNSEIDTSKSMLDDFEYGAVEGLMLLANCYKSDDLDDDKDRYCKKQGIHGSDYEIDEDEETFDDYDEEDESAVKTKCSKTKKRKRSLEDATTSMVKSYKCNICSKVFWTPQALGGHKSSAHPKILISPPDLLMVEAVRERGDEEEADDAIKKGSVAVSHICKACGKAFGSGQALGGHMRRHYHQGPAGAGEAWPSPVQLEMALVPCDHQSTVPRFDLNELPAEY